MRKPIILRNQFWLFWAHGMVIYPFMFFSIRYPSESLFKHEMAHVWQVRRMGWLKFYSTYIYLLIKHGYKNHPYEIEAWEYQKSELTETERKIYNEISHGR